LKHWDKEVPAKRKVISRIPEHRSDYRADPKARTARAIAWLIVHEEVAPVDGLERGAFEWTEMPAPATVTEIVAQYDHQHDALTSRLQAIFAPNGREGTAQLRTKRRQVDVSSICESETGERRSHAEYAFALDRGSSALNLARHSLATKNLRLIIIFLQGIG
jgi:hypothetical protein